MTETPIYPIRLPPYLREAIEKRVKKREIAKFIISAIEEKLKREK